MHEELVNRLGGLRLPRKSVVRLTDRPDMTLDVYRGCKTTIQPTNQQPSFIFNKEIGITFNGSTSAIFQFACFLIGVNSKRKKILSPVINGSFL